MKASTPSTTPKGMVKSMVPVYATIRNGSTSCISRPFTMTNRKLRQPSRRGRRLKRNLRMKM